MRSSTSSSKGTAFYVFALVALLLLAAVCVELTVRRMSHSYCKLELGERYGCASLPLIKRYLGESDRSRFYLGDSHVEFMVDYKGFRDYSIPALIPTEIVRIMKYLLRTRDVEHVLINLEGHHLQDLKRTRTWPVLAEDTLERQKFPFPIYALESALTTGVNRYLRDSLLRRPLPRLQGHQLFTDDEVRLRNVKRQTRQRAAAKIAPRHRLRWWETDPTVIKGNPWVGGGQKKREQRAKQRFEFFYPPRNYRKRAQYAAVLELVNLLKQHPEVNVCFVRFPLSEEYQARIDDPRFPRFKRAQNDIERIVTTRGFRYMDMVDMDWGLTRRDFRDSDHLLIQVIEAMTPGIVDECFPSLATEDKGDS